MAKKYRVQCDPACGFDLTTHNQKEAMRMSMEHVTEAHPDMKVTIDDVKKRIKEV